MLNVKYVILQQKISHEKLTLVHSNLQHKLYTYEFKNRLLRSFFVGKYEIVKDEYKRLELINHPLFKPDSIALLEEELSEQIFIPDSSKSLVKEFSPNKILFEVFTDKQSLFVISPASTLEMYGLT